MERRVSHPVMLTIAPRFGNAWGMERAD
jgi:hypothetical protein